MEDNKCLCQGGEFETEIECMRLSFVKMIPLPPICLSEPNIRLKAEEPYWSIQIKDGEFEDYIEHIKFCPFCGRCIDEQTN